MGREAVGMTIYTGRGDSGETDLRDAQRISKAAPRIEAYGSVDEVNSIIGTAIPTGYDDIDDQLVAIQNHLHIIQAQLANPEDDPDTPSVSGTEVEQLEAWIDEADEELDPLTAFILPGGAPTGATLHHARAVCRRAERRLVAFVETAKAVETTPVVYLNRLSDLLFTQARLVNAREEHTERNPTY